MGEQLAGLDVVIIASFLLAFKAILIEVARLLSSPLP